MKKRFFVLLTALLFIIDQGIKLYINEHYLDANIKIIKDMFYLNRTTVKLGTAVLVTITHFAITSVTGWENVVFSGIYSWGMGYTLV